MKIIALVENPVNKDLLFLHRKCADRSLRIFGYCTSHKGNISSRLFQIINDILSASSPFKPSSVRVTVVLAVISFVFTSTRVSPFLLTAMSTQACGML